MSDMPNVPRLGDDNCMPRVCQRLIEPGRNENGNESICGEPAKFHVIWDIITLDNSCCCLDHAREATEHFTPDAWHQLGYSCQMPGSMYFETENMCGYDEDGLPVGEVAENLILAGSKPESE